MAPAKQVLEGKGQQKDPEGWLYQCRGKDSCGGGVVAWTGSRAMAGTADMAGNVWGCAMAEVTAQGQGDCQVKCSARADGTGGLSVAECKHHH